MAETGAMRSPSVKTSTARDLEVDEPRTREAVRQPGEALGGRDPDGGGAVGERRAVAGRERSAPALAIEDRLQPRELLERRVAAGKAVLHDTVDEMARSVKKP
jgi:hypothetical protein